VKVWSLTKSKLYKMRDADELETLNMADENIMDMIMDDRTGNQMLTLHGHVGMFFT